MKKLNITAHFEYKGEEFGIPMWISGKMKDDLIKIADEQIKEGDDMVKSLHKVKENVEKIHKKRNEN